MQSLPLQAISAVAVLAVAGCPFAPDPLDDPRDPPIRTDQTEYVAMHVPGIGRLDEEHHEFDVVARYENPTGAVVYPTNCSGVAYFVWSADSEEKKKSPILLYGGV